MGHGAGLTIPDDKTFRRRVIGGDDVIFEVEIVEQISDSHIIEHDRIRPMLSQIALLERGLNDATDFSSRFENGDLMPLFRKSIGCTESADTRANDGDVSLTQFLSIIGDGLYQSSHVLRLS